MFEKIKSFVYRIFMKGNYTLFYSSPDEQIYVSNNYENPKIIVKVISKEIGKEIFDIIHSLKESNTEINLRGKTCKIIDCVSNHKKIKYFIIDFTSEMDIDIILEYHDRLGYVLSKNRYNIEEIYMKWFGFYRRLTDYALQMNILRYIINLSLELNKNGYAINKDKIEKIYKIDSISKILSCFDLESKSEKEVNDILIRYCHYYLSNKNDFTDFYKKINEELLIETADIPYDLEIVKRFYNYYLTGDYIEAIEYFSEEKNFVDKFYKDDDCENLILNTKICKKEENRKKEKSEYKIYKTEYGEIKILNRHTGNFYNFLISQAKSINYFDKDLKLIIDFDGKTIGFKEKEEDNNQIIDVEITKQEEIFDFFNKFMDFLIYLKKIKKYKIKNSNLDINKAIAVKSNFKFEFKTIENLYDFLRMNEDNLEKQAIEIFYQIYKKFIEKHYGNKYNEKELLKIPEIRYLSPVVTQGFINFYFDKEIDYVQIFNELTEFINYQKNIDEDSKILFDARFIYNPFVTPFKFDYEVEEKYGKKLKAGLNKKMADGRILVMFNEPKIFEVFAYEIKEKLEEIKKKIGIVESEHLKFVKISEVIYSKNIIKGVYECLGYITTPVKGNVLGKSFFQKLNNIELMYVFYYYFSNFVQYCIPYKNVQMDKNNMVFYINVLEDNFEIKKTNCNSTEEYLKKVIKFFIKIGYNSNAFIGFDYSSIKSLAIIKQLDKNNLDYCYKHNIYHTDKICPVCEKMNFYVDIEFIKENVIFEDTIAKHYEYDSNYNIKVYKTEAVNMLDMENRINKIIKNRLNSELINSIPENYEQDCFIPVKKAYNVNKEFIGYIYEKVSFEKEDLKTSELCINLEDTKKLKNLHRIKGIIRLLMQIKTLIKNGYTFSENPYGNVFLSKEHKKQVQLMNIEFIDTNGKIQETISWTYEYVFKIINLDENLEDRILINKIKENLNFELEGLNNFIYKLQDIVAQLTQYCNIHKMYYSQTHMLCPICSDGMNFENIKVKYISKKDITSEKKIGEGGEACIYKYNEQNVAKIFKEEINYSLKVRTIVKIMEKAKELEKIEEKAKINYVIPEMLLIDTSNKQVIGYVMKKVEGKPLSVLKDKKITKELEFSKKDILEILINVGKGIEKLHNNNLFIGDLNGRNILFDSAKQIYFLDFDGMGIDDISPEFYTDGYIDPISQKNQDVKPKDDWYSFAIQAFYYLTYTHPFNGIYMKDGKSLDIVEKMELRISLLGNHGIKPPSIAESWDWMSEELKNAFYNIFEKDLRISIVPFLIDQYNQRYKESSIKINYKFIAKKINHFGEENIKYVIDLNVAIMEENNQKYAIILTKNKRYLIKNMPYIEEINRIKAVTISKDGKYAFVIGNNEYFVLDLEKDKCISQKSGIKYNNIVVNDTSVYYIEYYKERYVITEETLSDDCQMQKSTFKVNESKQMLKFFGVEFNKKFVVIQATATYSDAIYCNNEKLCEIYCEKADTKYNIVYDNMTETWLVINEEKNTVVIKSDGTYEKSKLNVNGKVSVYNISYLNGKLYIPGYEELIIVNMKNQVIKKMECHKIMDSTSKICKTNTNGFSVITNGRMYEVYKD